MARSGRRVRHFENGGSFVHFIEHGDESLRNLVLDDGAELRLEELTAQAREARRLWRLALQVVPGEAGIENSEIEHPLTLRFRKVFRPVVRPRARNAVIGSPVAHVPGLDGVETAKGSGPIRVFFAAPPPLTAANEEDAVSVLAVEEVNQTVRPCAGEAVGEKAEDRYDRLA